MKARDDLFRRALKIIDPHLTVFVDNGRITQRIWPVLINGSQEVSDAEFTANGREPT
jgi:hypothetical protein